MVNYTLLFNNEQGVLRVTDASNEAIDLLVIIYYNGYELGHFPMNVMGGSFSVPVKTLNGKIAKGTYRIVYGSYIDDTIEYAHSTIPLAKVSVDGFGSRVRFYDSTAYGVVDDYNVIHHVPNGSVTTHSGNDIVVSPIYTGKGWFEYECRYYKHYEKYSVFDYIQGRIDYTVYGNDVDTLVSQLDNSIHTFKVEKQTRLNYYRDRLYDFLNKEKYYEAYKYYVLIYEEINDTPLVSELVEPYVPSVYDHLHSNKVELDKIGEVGGELGYNGVKVNAGTAERLKNGVNITIGSSTKVFYGDNPITFTISGIGAAPSTHTHTKSQITDFAHTHAISDVTNLQNTLNEKVNVSEVVTTATANKILKLDSNAALPANVTGNAATATRLQTARTINGTSFDGSGSITTSTWGTSRTITIGNTGKSVNGSGNVSWSLGEIGAAGVSHTHTIADVANLQDSLNGKVSKSGDVVSGNLAINGSAAVNRGTVDTNVALRFDNGTLTYGIYTNEVLENRTVYSYYTAKKVRYTEATTYNTAGIHASIYPLVSSGVSSGSYARGVAIEMLRNYDSSFDDSGTMAFFRGASIGYGHYNLNSASTPITTSAYGVYIQPYYRTGQIGEMFDIYLAADSTGGTVTNRYGIYQSNSGKNYFGGMVGIKRSPSYDLDVNGSARISNVSTGVVLSSSGVLSGLNGSSGNVLYHNGSTWTAKALDANDIGALPLYSSTQTIPANTPSGVWYRIAESAIGVLRCDGVFELECSGYGHNERLAFRATSIYNQDNSVTITRIGGGDIYVSSALLPIEYVRVVYKSGVSSSERAYVEVFVKNIYSSYDHTLSVRLFNSTGWSLTTGAGSIPAGYTTRSLSVRNANPYYSTNDTAGVITPSGGIATIDLRYPKRNSVAMNISGSTTINVSYVYDGCVGNILLNVTSTATITLGTTTNVTGNTLYKHITGNLNNLEPGFYIISYKCIPDAGGTWRAFFNVSPKYI